MTVMLCCVCYRRPTTRHRHYIELNHSVGRRGDDRQPTNCSLLCTSAQSQTYHGHGEAADGRRRQGRDSVWLPKRRRAMEVESAKECSIKVWL